MNANQMTATVIIAGATQTMSAIQTQAAVTPSPLPTEIITEVASADVAYDADIFLCEAILTNADPSDGRGTILARTVPGVDSPAWDTFSEDQRIQVLAQQADDTGLIWYLANRFFNELSEVSGWIRGDVVFIYGNCQPPRLSEDIFAQLLPPLDFACPLTIFDQPEANVYADANQEIFLLKIPLEAQAEAVARVAGENNRFWYNVRARLGDATVQGWLPSTAVQVAEDCDVPDLLGE